MSNQTNFPNKVVMIGTDAVTVPVLAADPVTAAKGDLYYNSTSDLVRFYNGTAWANIGAGGITALTGDVTASGSGSVAATIAAGAIDNGKVSASAAIAYSKLAALSTGQVVLGNAGVPTATTLGGDATVGATGTVTIAANAVTNAKSAQMAAHTFKGNNTGSTSNSIDLTATQLTAELNTFTSTLNGLVPLSGGGTSNYLRADGSWATPSGGGSSALYSYWKHTYADNTDAGGQVSGSWVTRTINDRTGDTSYNSLSSNQITLNAGTYQIDFTTEYYNLNAFQSRFRNITDSTTPIIGIKGNVGTNVVGFSRITGTITIASTKVFEVQGRVQTTNTTNGWGLGNQTFGELGCSLQGVIIKTA